MERPSRSVSPGKVRPHLQGLEHAQKALIVLDQTCMLYVLFAQEGQFAPAGAHIAFKSTADRFSDGREGAGVGPGAYGELTNVSYELSKKIFGRPTPFGSTTSRATGPPVQDGACLPAFVRGWVAAARCAST